MTSTLALGVSVDTMGRIVVMYRNDAAELVVVDVTSVVESVAQYVYMTRAVSVRAPGVPNGTIADSRYVH